MKLAVRASILCLALTGAAAGVASTHAAKVQTETVSRLAVALGHAGARMRARFALQDARQVGVK